ncbi:hypothetical protein [Pseudonocardia sp. ICBG1034]|uniref:hypothetical protein n=1 Tax=Pseudonocardia sp. ICBG1034 TaxID=2844381 RepID=UPI001CCCC56E|nr:hypothetical protein [Pseudonocardia sp. ICBG1034]
MFRKVDDLGVVLVLVLMVGVVSAFHPQFVERASLSNMAMQTAFYGIIAVGMVFLLSRGSSTSPSRATSLSLPRSRRCWPRSG